MEHLKNQELTLARIRLIADMTLISQIRPDEMQAAISLIADLAHGAVETEDFQQALQDSGDIQWFKAWFEQHSI
ncbi:hypothetical protein AU490_14100 [Lonsdalea populi]|uniref:Uncharacterized protein n=3 Tax=Pectobacteriaceae TaxID=1903410 RepID=A0ACD1JC28_9GAMM|nr:hypothetical protein AU508_09635 [Lonsdalea populi]RAT12944.1 hypothetical protein AU485_10275 [Lonsdalea quercina]OSN01452.1 hypothetical protein AU499_06085 [Lonsdalea populi]QPQ22779.1 hypothetical protein I6N93_08650 [Lonsdalea populi]RAT15307.1 hypothetical protein AU486_10335 [Lonsdalea quercina]